MKSLIILILMVVLVAGACLSRPTEKDFSSMIHQKVASQQKDDLLELILHGGKGKADVFLQSCKFHDRLLWTSVERDGKTIYTGAFGHWFANDLKIEAGK